MVAQISSETFNRDSLTPPMDDSDSDDLVLALETARVLEGQGDIAEAVRWLRRAADQAEKDGNDARVLVLARAAADLANMIAPRTPVPRAPAPQSPSRPASAPAPVSARVSSPPPIPSRIPSPRPPSAPSSPPRVAPAVMASARGPVSAPPAPTSVHAMPPRVGSRPAPPPRTSSAPSPALASPRKATVSASRAEDKRVTERTLAVDTLRVAIPASRRDAAVFVVRRLEKGQPLPAGTTEATLVLTADGEW